MWRKLAVKHRVKSEVLTHKKILISDPSVNKMNDTQWLFEYEGLKYAEECKLEEYKAISQYIKKGFISMLGLDLFPIEEEVGTDPAGQPIMKYRRPEDHEIMPLAVYVGREEILAEVAKRHQELALQEKADSGEVEEEFVASDMSLEDLDGLFGSDSDSDISFPTGPEDIRKHNIWNSATTQATLKSMFVEKSDSDEDLEDEFAPAEIIRGEKKSPKVTVE